MKKILCLISAMALIMSCFMIIASAETVYPAGERILCDNIYRNGMATASYSNCIGSAAYWSTSDNTMDAAAITEPEMSFKFNITTPGTYVIYTRAMLETNGSDSFFYNIDNTGWTERHPNAQGADFKWIDVVTCHFEAGEHTFQWHHRESGGVFDCFSVILADGNYRIIVDGSELKTDVEPYLENGVSMVPFRAFGEALGAEVQWLPAERAATMTKGNVTLKVLENSDKAYFNKFPMTIATPARIINGRFMVPARFVADNLGHNVNWYSKTNHAFIANK